jgi:type VI secretion system secreted protein Hcp
MKYCASGKHIDSAMLTARKAGGDQQEHLVLKLKDVIISNVSTSGAQDSELTEIVSLNFSKVELEYKPQKADGSLDAGVFFKYDLKAVKAY